MNLRIFRPRVVELDKDGNETEVSAAEEHVIGPLMKLELEFLRGVGHATYKMSNGVPVTESFELSYLYPDGIPEFLFDANSENKSSAPRRAVNAVTGSQVPTEEEKKATEEKNKKVKEEQEKKLEESKKEKLKNESSEEKKKREAKEKEEAEILAKMTPEKRAQFQKDLAENEKQAALLANQGAMQKPASQSVNVASAVGHLTDPTTQDTGKLQPGGKLNVPDAS